MSSKSKIVSIIVISLVLFLSMLNVIEALSEDFTAYSSGEIEVCACTPFTDKIEVENTGDILSVYGIRHSGSASRYVQAIPNSFFLASDEKSIVTNYISIPCNAIGDYYLTTNIRTNMGLEKELTQKLIIKECSSIKLVPEVSKNIVCSGDTAVFEMSMKNIALYQETYIFSVDKLSKMIAISENPLVLQSGEEKPVFIYVNTKDIIGEETIMLSVETEQSGFTTSVPLSLQAGICDYYGAGYVEDNVEDVVVNDVSDDKKVVEDVEDKKSDKTATTTKKTTKTTNKVMADDDNLKILLLLLLLLLLLIIIIFLIIIPIAIKRKKARDSKVEPYYDSHAVEMTKKKIEEKTNVKDKQKEKKDEKQWVEFPSKEFTEFAEEGVDHQSFAKEDKKVLKKFSYDEGLRKGVIVRLIILLIIILIIIALFMLSFMLPLNHSNKINDNQSTTEDVVLEKGGGMIDIGVGDVEDQPETTEGAKRDGLFWTILDYFLAYLWYIIAAIIILLILIYIAKRKGKETKDKKKLKDDDILIEIEDIKEVKKVEKKKAKKEAKKTEDIKKEITKEKEKKNINWRIWGRVLLLLILILLIVGLIYFTYLKPTGETGVVGEEETSVDIGSGATDEVSETVPLVEDVTSDYGERTIFDTIKDYLWVYLWYIVLAIIILLILLAIAIRKGKDKKIKDKKTVKKKEIKKQSFVSEIGQHLKNNWWKYLLLLLLIILIIMAITYYLWLMSAVLFGISCFSANPHYLVISIIVVGCFVLLYLLIHPNYEDEELKKLSGGKDKKDKKYHLMRNIAFVVLIILLAGLLFMGFSTMCYTGNDKASKDAAEDKTGLTDMNEETSEKIQSLQEEIDNLKITITEMLAENENEPGQEDIDVVSMENLRDRLDSLSIAMNGLLSQIVDDKVKSEDDLTNLREEINALKKETDNLNNAVNELLNNVVDGKIIESDEIKNLRGKVNQLQSDIESLDSAINALSMKVGQNKIMNDEQEKKLSGLRKDMDNLNNAVNQLLGVVVGEEVGKDKEIKDLQEKVEDLSKSMDELIRASEEKRRADEARDNIQKNLQNDVDILEKKLDELMKKLDEKEIQDNKQREEIFVDDIITDAGDIKKEAIEDDVLAEQILSNIYFSPIPGWQPDENPNGIVVYITYAGVSLGNSSIGGRYYDNVNKDVDVKKKTGQQLLLELFGTEEVSGAIGEIDENKPEKTMEIIEEDTTVDENEIIPEITEEGYEIRDLDELNKENDNIEDILVEDIGGDEAIDKVTEEIDEDKEAVDDILKKIEGITEDEKYKYQIIDENSFIEINLTTLFYDPDGDELTFTSTKPENVDVEIWKGTALLRPKKDFYGVDKITFIAEDTSGEKVNSSEITIIVLYGDESDGLWSKIVSIFKLYKAYIAVGIAILLLLILLAIANRESKVKKKRK